MTRRTLAEIHRAYEAWVPGCTVNGVPREPKPSTDFEFAAFMQGYHFGLMKDKDFFAVVKRMRAERKLEPPDIEEQK